MILFILLLLCPLIGAEKYTFGILADTHIGKKTPASEKNLLKAIEAINGKASARNIKAVFVLGDVTDDGSNQGYLKAQTMLNKLKVPYFVVMGNHDDRGHRTGDHRFTNHFGPTLNTTTKYYTIQPVRSDQWKTNFYLQNWFLTLGGNNPVHFISLDWVMRDRKPGSHVAPVMHDMPGGTVPWLKSLCHHLANLSSPIILLQHHPFACAQPSSPYCFTQDQRAIFQHIIEKDCKLSPTQLWGVLAGHTHALMHKVGKEVFQKDVGEWNKFEEWVIPACKNSGKWGLGVVDGKKKIAIEQF